MPAPAGQEENSLQSSLTLAGSRGPSLLSRPGGRAASDLGSGPCVALWRVQDIHTHPTGPFRVIIPKKILLFKKKNLKIKRENIHRHGHQRLWADTRRDL